MHHSQYVESIKKSLTKGWAKGDGQVESHPQFFQSLGHNKARIFYWLIYKPSHCNFPESRKKKLISTIIFLFYQPTLNIICFVEKIYILLRFCLCILRVTLSKVIVLSRFLGKL